MAKMWSHELHGNMIHHYDTTTLDAELQGGYEKHGPQRSFHGDHGSCITTNSLEEEQRVLCSWWEQPCPVADFGTVLTELARNLILRCPSSSVFSALAASTFPCDYVHGMIHVLIPGMWQTRQNRRNSRN